MPTRPVLIVEDDLAQAESMRALIAGAGYEVRVAAHGQEAIDLLRGGLGPGVIFLDLIMPVMSGYEFLRRIWDNEAWSALPVVVVTGADVRNPGGVVGFVRKPMNPSEVMSAVRHFCGAPVEVEAVPVDGPQARAAD